MTKTLGLKTKTKTLFFVLEAPRDQAKTLVSRTTSLAVSLVYVCCGDSVAAEARVAASGRSPTSPADSQPVSGRRSTSCRHSHRADLLPDDLLHAEHLRRLQLVYVRFR